MFMYYCVMNEEVNEFLELCVFIKFIYGKFKL